MPKPDLHAYKNASLVHHLEMATGYRNKMLGEVLEGSSRAGDIANVLIKIDDQDVNGTLLELAKLGIKYMAYAEGYTVIELSYDLLKLIGENGLGEALQQAKFLKANTLVDFVNEDPKKHRYGTDDKFNKAKEADKTYQKLLRQMYNRE